MTKTKDYIGLAVITSLMHNLLKVFSVDAITGFLLSLVHRGSVCFSTFLFIYLFLINVASPCLISVCLHFGGEGECLCR